MRDYELEGLLVQLYEVWTGSRYFLQNPMLLEVLTYSIETFIE